MSGQVVMELPDAILCVICLQPIVNPEMWHPQHVPGCVKIAGCDCDMYAHAECCPMCKAVTK